MHSQVRGALICGWFIFFYHGRNTENHVSEDKTGAGPIEILLLFQNCVCIGNISSSVNSSDNNTRENTCSHSAVRVFSCFCRHQDSPYYFQIYISDE